MELRTDYIREKARELGKSRTQQLVDTLTSTICTIVMTPAGEHNPVAQEYKEGLEHLIRYEGLQNVLQNMIGVERDYRIGEYFKTVEDFIIDFVIQRV